MNHFHEIQNLKNLLEPVFENYFSLIEIGAFALQYCTCVCADCFPDENRDLLPSSFIQKTCNLQLG